MTIYETLQAVEKNPENLPKIALFARECAAAADAAWAAAAARAAYATAADWAAAAARAAYATAADWAATAAEHARQRNRLSVEEHANNTPEKESDEDTRSEV